MIKSVGPMMGCMPSAKVSVTSDECRCTNIPPLNQHLPLLRWKHLAPLGHTWPCTRNSYKG